MEAGSAGLVVILVMGVSGSGKSTVGDALARSLGWAFIDADDYHAAESRALMAAGIPLTDEQRRPWLVRLRMIVDDLFSAGRDAVLACSALRASYREELRGGRENEMPVVYLRGDEETIRARMEQREHFMRPGMLASQFETLEEPDDAIVAPISASVGEIVATVRRSLGLDRSEQGR